ncbi:iduronate-2-sulfatase [Sphingobium sp. SCG-1]|uniref:sulfatase n=1 Tax=Sphingobium sp. SCG-1 TaxID=2072936 RepID=UPI000CD6B3FE|nr:sulfatase [Sphingobium sp. SCG-1]AUW57224.1 iduronate-2-sulfatase [Sphingobium sp. SCG-1]
MAAATIGACTQTLPVPNSGLHSSTLIPTKRPNILLIMIDDLKPTLGSFGDRTAISPNIDALAARGTRFEHAYANQAVCAPSRINLMTGRRSTSTGIYDFGMDLRQYVPNAVTLPQAFKLAGYEAESIGKVFHVGHGSHDDDASWSRPPIHDHVIEYNDPESTGGKPTREQALFNEVPVEGNVWKYAATLSRGAAWESPDIPDEAYADGRTAKRASDRLRELKSSASPFFLAVGFARPHLPFSVPKKYWDMYDPSKLPMPNFERLPDGAPPFAGKVGGEIAAYRPIPEGQVPGRDFPEPLKRKLIHGYYAGVSYVDVQIGRVLDALKREGLADNTIVVLWGDHGWHLGDHGIWTKHTNFEQAVRQPLIIAGPGTGLGGRAPAQLAETVDIYPTLAALAGLTLPRTMQPLDGLSLVPVLRDTRKIVRPYAYHAYPRPGHIGQAIRGARYRLVRWTQETTGERSYELYDLQADPGETRNQADVLPKVRAQLETYLDAQPKPVTLRLAAERPTRPGN